MQDVLPPQPPKAQDAPQKGAPAQGIESRSIRDIPVPANRRHFIPLSEDYAPDGGGGKRGASFFVWSIGLIVVCAALGLFVANFFSGATVTVTPRQASVTLPSNLSAQLDAPVGTLAFQTIALAQSSDRTVAANGTTEINSVAQGSITIYNGYSTASQKLVANTRFETPDGKIYKIHQSVTIPGGKKQVDGSLSPGSVSVNVYASAPGSDYNIGATRFTIPGFKGAPQYSKIYAETAGISGGASGTRPSVAQSDMVRAQSDLEQELTGTLTAAIAAQVPDGFVAVGGAVAVDFGGITVADATGGQAKISETATATAAVVRISDVANAIAKSQIQGYSGEAVTFTDPSALVLALAAGTSFGSRSSAIDVVPTGASLLVWQYDADQIRQALVGKPKADFNSIAPSFAPSIAKAQASIRPFWKTSFPTDPSKIKIVTGN